ncbi:MAG: NTP transferase domain-containing protein, partial [Roseiflexaceae bacterium]
ALVKLACMLLAAGLSRRLGQPKQLLPWQGSTLVRYSAQVALAAQLDPIVVVTGHHADAVQAQVHDLAVTCIYNDAYADGQGSSVACGARWLLTQSPACDAVVVLLCDQPFLTAKHVTQCVAAWALHRPDVLIPRVDGVRTNPVIWAVHALPLLAQLTGEQGGRVLFTQGVVTPAFVDIADKDLLIDIDTHADYLAVQHRIEES